MVKKKIPLLFTQQVKKHMALSLDKIKSALEDGLLSFPITDMDEQGAFKADTYAERLSWFVSHGVSSVFVAGGT